MFKLLFSYGEAKMIIIAAGANLPSRYGDPGQTILAAIHAVEGKGVRITGRSRIWLTSPVPASDQPDFHNAVFSVATDLDAENLLNLLHGIEADFGRVRIKRNEPRIIDLDLIAYNNVVMDGKKLSVPHPRLQDRAFVLMPLRDIAPDWVHPVTGADLSSMLDLIPAEQRARPK